MKFLKASILILALCLFAQPALSATHGPAAFMRKIDRQLCAKFKSLKCHRKKTPQSTPKAKTPSEKPAALQAPMAAEPIPKPVLKPEVPLPTKSPAVLPPIKPALAVPVPPAEVPRVNKVPAVLPPVKPSVSAPVVPVIIPVQPPASVANQQPSDGACLAVLKAKHVDFQVVDQPLGLPACVVVQPVQLKSALVNGVVLQLPDHPILNCAFAVHFVEWMQDLGGPAAVAKEGFALKEFYTGPGYQCRGRNGETSAKISEHGFGNAVDIERMKFSDGQVFLVHDAPDPAARAYETLKAIRVSACARFTTVLGPGSNEAHREHFHFDNGAHGKSGIYKICE